MLKWLLPAGKGYDCSWPWFRPQLTVTMYEEPAKAPTSPLSVATSASPTGEVIARFASESEE